MNIKRRYTRNTRLDISAAGIVFAICFLWFVVTILAPWLGGTCMPFGMWAPVFDPLFLATAVVGIVFLGIRKRFWFALLLANACVVLVLCRYGHWLRPAVASPSEDVLKVVSANVAHFSDDETHFYAFADWLVDEAPDVVLLQEFGLRSRWPNVKSGIEELSAITGLSHFTFKPQTHNIYGCALLSKHPIEHDTVLSESIGPVNQIVRYALQIDGEEIHVFNCQLTSYNFSVEDTKRLSPFEVVWEQAREVDLILSAYDSQEPTMVVGDFNTVFGSPILYRLEGVFASVFRKVGSGLGYSVHWVIPLALDHAFLSSSLRPDYTELRPLSFSDHDALVFGVRM